MPLNVHDSGRSASYDAVLAVIAVLLQFSVGTQVFIFGGSINFMVAIACAYALHADIDRAVIAGFAAGALYDLSAPVPLGLLTLLLTIASFALASMSRGSLGQLTGDSGRILLIVIAVVDTVYAGALFLMGIETSLLTALLGHGVATAGLTFIASALVLWLGHNRAASSGVSSKTLLSRSKKTLR